jgi:hypothetical protein
MRTAVSLFLAAVSATSQAPGLATKEITARAKALELNTPYILKWTPKTGYDFELRLSGERALKMKENRCPSHGRTIHRP